MKLALICFIFMYYLGRTLYSTSYLLNNLNETSTYNGYPGVYACGCLVLDKDGSVIRSIEFILETLKRICNYLDDNNLFPNTTFITLSRPLKCTNYTDELNMRSMVDRYPPIEFVEYKDLLKESIRTVIIFSNDDLTNIEIPRLKNGIDFVVTRSSHDTYEVTPPGCSKTEGFKMLMEYFGEDPSSCGYIGNHENDVEIMQLSNLSFAVNNADDYVKREAKYSVNLTNNEAAVAYTLQQVYDIAL